MSGPDARHDRQRLLEWLGNDGQTRLRRAHAAVVGCGALGSVEAEWLVRAGIGTLTLIDRDTVEWSNLQRQSLYTERDAERAAPKAEAARQRLREIDRSARLHACVEHLDAGNAEALLRGVDVIIDGLDNAEGRYLLNDYAVAHGVPFIHAAAVGMEGRTLAVLPGRPCLRCFFRQAPAPGALGTCDTVGVFGPVIGAVGALAAADALRVAAGRSDLVPNGLHAIDLAAVRVTTIGSAQRPDAACPCCAGRSFEWLAAPVIDAAVLCGRGAVQIAPAQRHGSRSEATFDLASVAQRLAHHGAFTERDGLLRGTLSSIESPEGHPVELTLFADGRAIIGGSTDLAFARSVYGRFVGI
ncbi:MAG: ThiF family adenylyltransferase [Phycisphaeraceae bacterium]|nr:ThiF family adenylyltransferase [Phycisphaeraceae bacterium]